MIIMTLHALVGLALAFLLPLPAATRTEAALATTLRVMLPLAPLTPLLARL